MYGLRDDTFNIEIDMTLSVYHMHDYFAYIMWKKSDSDSVY